MLTIDGSSHDAHQHEILMKLVDGQILEECFDTLYQRVELDPSIKKACYKRLSTFKYKITATYPEKAQARNPLDSQIMALFTGMVTGKVMSGHPFVTSTGNTLRCLAYVKYLEYKMQQIVPSFVLLPGQAGDDGMHHIFWKKEDIDSKDLSSLLLAKVGELIGSSESEG